MKRKTGKKSEKIDRTQPDVLWLDIEMPVHNGWDILARLKTTRPQPPIRIRRIFPERPCGLRFLKAGTAGYLNKTSAPDQLVTAIRKVAEGLYTFHLYFFKQLDYHESLNYRKNPIPH